MPKEAPTPQTWLDRPFLPNFKFTWEIALVALLLVAAVFSRLYGLGDRTISHDETTHVVFAWDLEQGLGYAHDPLSHGPLQFHLLALSYFIFGDSDFTARLPQALFSIATVLFAWWAFRRYLGRIGALIAGFLFLISPYMLYYGRYARNEAFVALFGVVMIWGILRYLDRGENKYLYLITASLALHFASKETVFIYAAQALLFLGLLFLSRVNARKWIQGNIKQPFFVTLLLGAVLLVLAVFAQAVGGSSGPGTLSGSEVAEPVVATGAQAAAAGGGLNLAAVILVMVGILALGVSIYFLLRGYGWKNLKQERSFGLMALIFALVLPNLAAFPLKILAPTLSYSTLRNMVSATNVGTILSSPDFPSLLLLFGVIMAMFLLSAAIGFAWNPRQYLINMGIFFAIFIPLFTTFFTNSLGFFTGLVGALGYWIEQQAVQRGSQPWYYYWAVQLPMYEFLPALGSLMAAAIGFRLWGIRKPEKSGPALADHNLLPAESRRLALVFMVFWAATALVAYSIAGEKMPWLTVHITLPLLLLTGWALGWVIKHVDWAQVLNPRGQAIIASMAIALLSAIALFSILLGIHLPFQGMEQVQLQDTMRFVLTTILFLGALYVLVALTTNQEWRREQTRRVFAVMVFIGLALLTARTAFRAAYINYDLATEYLVYAHMAAGPKEMMNQLKDLSERLTDGLGITVAYDNETNYPLWWYLRNYPNKVYYDVNPSMSLREDPVIIVGDANYSKIEPIVRDDYYKFEFVRIWWPNQDYFDFTRSSIGYGFTTETGLDASQMSTLDYLGRLIQRLAGYVDTGAEREALMDIWLNRDFTHYLDLRGQDPSLAAWNPSRSMRMYVRKDIAAQIWDYGVSPVAIQADPYAGKGLDLPADIIIGGPGNQNGQFNSPRGLAAAPDGTLYVADSLNNRIQHFDEGGGVLQTWGTQTDPNSTDKPEGTFSEPWGVAVAPDGSVYVADTWNHRIQKFDANGLIS